MSSGKDFEKLVHGYYDSVRRYFNQNDQITLDEKVPGPDGDRQCDVTIKSHLHGEPYSILIECKDHGRPLTIEYVDAFTSKLADLGFNKGIIVARSGFQSGAITKAHRVGIELYSFAAAQAAAHDIPLSVPILHMVIRVSDLHITFNAIPDILPPLIRLSEGVAVGVDVKRFMAEYIRPDPRLLTGRGYKAITPREPFYIETMAQVAPALIYDQPHDMSDIQAYLEFSTDAYVGTLADVEKFYVKRDPINEKSEAYIPEEEIGKLSQHLPFYGSGGEVPRYLFEGGFVTFTIDLTREIPRTGLFEVASIKDVFDQVFPGLTPPVGKWVWRYTETEAHPRGGSG